MSNRVVILAGATGLVGQALLDGLLADPGVEQVHTPGRRKPPQQHAKLDAHVVDFGALAALPPADELYLALGTTLKVAGSQAAFRAVDHEANLAVARAARTAGVRRVGLVSAMGADASSPVFYNRVKGELERDLARLGFEGLVIARPSLLIGPREALGQPLRRGEQWGERIARCLDWLIPANYKPIAATDVAAALLTAVPRATGRQLLPSGAMRADAARTR